MQPVEKVAHVGIPGVVGLATYALVWEFFGEWLLPWLLLFWIGPMVGWVVWSFGR